MGLSNSGIFERSSAALNMPYSRLEYGCSNASPLTGGPGTVARPPSQRGRPYPRPISTRRATAWGSRIAAYREEQRRLKYAIFKAQQRSPLTGGPGNVARPPSQRGRPYPRPISTRRATAWGSVSNRGAAAEPASYKAGPAPQPAHRHSVGCTVCGAPRQRNSLSIERYWSNGTCEDEPIF